MGGGGGNGTTVTGHRRLHYRLETGEVSVADPTPVRIHVPADGGWIELATTPTGDGGFVVDGVPAGEFYAQAEMFWVVTSERSVNLDDFNNLGRPGTPQAADGIPVRASLTGLTPTDYPSVVLISPNTAFYAELSLDNAPFPSPVTALNAEPGTLEFVFGGLPGANPTDSTYLWQQVERDGGELPDGGQLVTYVSAEAAARLVGASIPPSGGPLTAALGASRRVVESTTVASDEFARWATAVHPSARMSSLSVDVFPTPNPPGLTETWSGYSGSLLTYYVAPVGGGDLPVVLEYVDPFPASGWSHIHSYAVIFSTPTLLPGTSSGRTPGAVQDMRPQAVSRATPRISPAQRLAFDHVASTAPGRFANLTPSITWAAPAFGTPSGYVVTIYRLTASGMRTTRQASGFFFTRGTAIQVPPGVLRPTSSYLVKVTAFVTPAVDWRTAPLGVWSTSDQGSADTISSIWTTQ